MSDEQNKNPERSLFANPRWIVLAVLGGVGLYLATWVGPVSFYFNFQKTVLAEGAGEVHRPVIWHVPREVKLQEGESWRYHRTQEGVGFPLPPPSPRGREMRLENEGDLYIAHLDEATIRYQRFQPGFLVFLFQQELEQVGGRDDRLLNDSLILHEILREVPGRYEIGMSARDRRHYAARILSKMLLFESKPAVRVEASTRLDPLRTAVLVEFATGEVKILRVDEEGVLVILLPSEAPREWKDSPGLWLGGEESDSPESTSTPEPVGGAQESR